jgi:hypothetical protein
MSTIDAARILLELREITRVSSVVDFAEVTRLELSFIQRGGKGGFGKLLKSQKNLGKNTDNFDSCRDLEGRKLKYSRREEKVDSLKKGDSHKQKDISEEKPSKSAVMLDEKYIKTLSQIGKEKQEAIAEGLKASTEFEKPSETVEPPQKKIKKIAFFDDEDSE